MRVISHLTLIATLALSLAVSAQTPAVPPPERAPAESVGQLIGVQSEMTRLESLSAHSDVEHRWEILWQHQRILERVMAASLQVDATIAQIDNEIARSGEVHGLLADRRDRVVSRANLLAAVLGGAVGATSSGIAASSTLTKPAAAVRFQPGRFRLASPWQAFVRSRAGAVGSASSRTCWRSCLTDQSCPTAIIRRPCGRF